MEQGGILSGHAIVNAISEGLISISPFRADHVNAASYDLTLGSEVRVYEDVTWVDGDEGGPPHLLPKTMNVLDAAKPNPTRLINLKPGQAFRLVPGVGYLMHTIERVHSKCFVPVLDGKSSIGRLFISIHETAGYGDPDFDGQYTLEVTCTHPIRVYQGMRFGQIRFHTIVGKVLSYADLGKYKGEFAKGAVASQAYKMFETKE